MALGEIGLDYHYDFSPRDIQQEVFRRQLRLARKRDLPVIIHTREATDDTFRLLADESAGLRVVFHCFTGGLEMAATALDMGAVLSFAGIVTFPKAAELREVARDGARRPVPGRNRLALPCPGAVPRQAQRAGVRRSRGGSSRDRPREAGARRSPGSPRETFSRVFQRSNTALIRSAATA